MGGKISRPSTFKSINCLNQNYGKNWFNLFSLPRYWNNKTPVKRWTSYSIYIPDKVEVDVLAQPGRWGTAPGNNRLLWIMWPPKCFEHIFVFFWGCQSSPLPTTLIHSLEKLAGNENNETSLEVEVELQDLTIQYLDGIFLSHNSMSSFQM